MQARLEKVFAEVFKVSAPKLTDSLGPDDVKGWDSLGHLGLVEALEAEFQIQFQDGDLTEMENVGQIKAILEKRGVAP